MDKLSHVQIISNHLRFVVYPMLIRTSLEKKLVTLLAGLIHGNSTEYHLAGRESKGVSNVSKENPQKPRIWRVGRGAFYAFYGCFGNSNANQTQILKKRPSDGNVDVHGLEMPGFKVLF